MKGLTAYVDPNRSIKGYAVPGVSVQYDGQEGAMDVQKSNNTKFANDTIPDDNPHRLGKAAEEARAEAASSYTSLTQPAHSTMLNLFPSSCEPNTVPRKRIPGPVLLPTPNLDQSSTPRCRA